MSRTSFIVSIGFCILLPGSLCAQALFPSPSAQLHDVKFKFTEPHPDRASRLRVVNGRIVGLPRTPTQINSLAFSLDGKLLAAGKEYGRLVVWDVASKQIASIIDTGFTGVGRIAISPDNQFIAAAAETGPGIKVWHIPDGQLATAVDNTHGNILQLIYMPNSNSLIVFSQSTDVFNTTSGKLTGSFVDDRDPLLSTDGSTLLTMEGPEIVLRNTSDWTIQRTLHKLTESEVPVFLDVKQGVFLFKDVTDDHVFIAARTSDGQLLPNVKLANLPKSSLNFFDFAAIDPSSGIAFGHSAGQLWALDLKTGKTCLSQQLFSESGALSPDGSLLAGAFEPEMPSDEQKKAGVGLWKTEDLARACHMQ
jgi:WD40 repeat protein